MTSAWTHALSHPSPPPPTILTDSDSDANGLSSGTETNRHSDLSDSIFKPYLEFSGHSGADLSKIQSFLTSSSVGALSCLICLERIKPSDPTWSCSSLCFAVFHLICIQSWARQASDLAAARAAIRLPIFVATASDTALWKCPKCRSEYPKSLIPKMYLCFCGKVEKPPNDLWVLPHSYREVCGRPLKHNCGHHCLLLFQNWPGGKSDMYILALVFVFVMSVFVQSLSHTRFKPCRGQSVQDPLVRFQGWSRLSGYAFSLPHLLSTNRPMTRVSIFLQFLVD